MAKPTYQIWKNKPDLNSEGQYIQVGVDDYYAVGFDTDDPTDDIYSDLTNLGRGVGTDINQNTYFEANSLALNDHIYGVGEFRIERIKIDIDSSVTGNENQNHNNSQFRVHFVDSAAFLCPTGTESTCVQGGRSPVDDIDPMTGEWLDGDEDIIDRWFTYVNGVNDAFTHNRMFYRVYAGNHFDCAWGDYNEFEPNDQFELVGQAIVDTADGESLEYFPMAEGQSGNTFNPPAADSDLWRWRFFPYVNLDNVKNFSKYNYDNGFFPLIEGDMEWEDFVIGESFSNVANVTWGDDDNYSFDYDGAFYLAFWFHGARCDNHQAGNYWTIPSVTIYSIPKKHIFDNWNGYKPLCFRWGTDGTACEAGDIEFYNDIPHTYRDDSYGEDRSYHLYNAEDVRIRIIPPRVFYETDERADVWRPVDNSNAAVHMKNPIEKDPRNIYFSQEDECIFPTQLIEDTPCPYSAFFPYVSEQVPYLYSPSNDVDFTGNLVGITDGTIGLNRTDGIATNIQASTADTEDILSAQLDTQYIRDRNFRPFAYAWMGEEDLDDPLGLSVQRRYPLRSVEEAQTSAPNFVNFWMGLATPLENGVLDDDYIFDMSDEKWHNDIYLGSGLGYKWCIARWGDEEDAGEIEDSDLIDQIKMWSVIPQGYYQEVVQTGRYEWKNIRDDDGLGLFSHQYQSEGPKEIKAFVFSYIKNEDQAPTFNRIFDESDIVPFQSLHWKLVTIRINVNLSDVFVEDFSEIGGSDFTYIPMNIVTPIIGGIHKESSYVKSSTEIYNSNLFHPTEILDRIRTRKAVENDHMGYWPGKMDLEQIRLFDKPFDITYLLGIGDEIAIASNRFRPHTYRAYWDGIENSFSNETSVGEIFISDNVDINLKSSCVLELNTATLFGNKILDSSGNGNIGILIGDYSLSKDDKLEPVVRESNMKTPNVEDQDGAI
jgi:hypothetical protein